MSIQDYADRGPVFLPEKFLAGELSGWGIIESPLGGLQRRFTVEAKGSWHVDTRTITFTETWTFDDGMVETLAWQIAKEADGLYRGSEPKLDGSAAGQAAGFAFHWTYARQTPQASGGTVTLNFDDWFYLIDENVCIVRGTAGRFGLPFAVVHVMYQKRG